MKHLAVLFLVAFVTPASPQSLVSPEVQADGRVTFRLQAPNAKDVVLRCEGVKPATMQKDDQGVWSITTEPLAPDVYVYSFAVDGIRVLDPGNPVLKYNLFSTENQVHVPGPAALDELAVTVEPHGVRLYKFMAAR